MQRERLGSTDWTIEDRGFDTPCWIWKGRPNNKGYGKVGIAGRVTYAHRAVYEQEIGPIPAGLKLDHLCRVTLCVNPAHLEPVTHAENLHRGIGTRLSSSQVAAIRLDTRSCRAVAGDYGISHTYVSRLRRGLARPVPRLR